jgi:hypothetical protein
MRSMIDIFTRQKIFDSYVALQVRTDIVGSPTGRFLLALH